MANETLIETVFTNHHAETRIAALVTAIEVARENDVDPFPAAVGASDEDRLAVKKASERITLALDTGAALDPVDVSTVYLGRKVDLSTNDETLLSHRFAMAAADFASTADQVTI